MAVVPHTVDIVVADMQNALAFYRTLGLAAPAPVGQRVTFACRCDSSSELDATYARILAAGYAGVKEPWDAFWGQRYAMDADPDGNRVDLFSPIAPRGRE